MFLRYFGCEVGANVCKVLIKIFSNFLISTTVVLFKSNFSGRSFRLFFVLLVILLISIFYIIFIFCKQFKVIGYFRIFSDCLKQIFSGFIDYLIFFCSLLKKFVIKFLFLLGRFHYSFSNPGTNEVFLFNLDL